MLTRIQLSSFAFVLTWLIPAMAYAQMTAGRADDAPSKYQGPSRAQIEQTCARQSKGSEQAMESCMCQLAHDPFACKTAADLAKSARQAADRKRAEELHRQDVERQIHNFAALHPWYYAGPGAASVRYLLSATPGWQLASCVECQDMVLPEVRVSTSSMRDQYVGEAVMHAWAAENYAALGLPEKAAAEGNKVLDALKTTNSLCSPGGVSFGDPNQPPERTTEDVWPCPAPDLSYLAVLHVTRPRASTNPGEADAQAASAANSAPSEAAARMRARLAHLMDRSADDAPAGSSADATPSDDDQSKSFVQRLLGDTTYNRALAQQLQAQRTLNAAMRTKNCGSAREAVELFDSAIAHYQAVSGERASMAAQEATLLENSKRIAERQVQLTCR